MNSNLGLADRIIRTVMGLFLIAFAGGLIAPNSGLNVFGWVGLVPLATAFISFCPLYRLVGASTCGLRGAE